MPRILLLLPTKTYRSSDFLAAARKLELDVTVASEEPSTMEALAPDALLTLDLTDPGTAVSRARAFASHHGVSAVLGVDEPTVHVAACISEELGLPGNSVAATLKAKDKSLMRAALRDAGLRIPAFRVESLDAPPRFLHEISYPCVMKPLVLSASRGVMRADDPHEARARFERLRRLMDSEQVRDKKDAATRRVLVEDFVPGVEVALEGLLQDGELRVLAVFDKPDPLDGPFFPETIYVTPSRLHRAAQDGIAEAVGAAASALGLEHGPIHAEARVSERGVFVLEVAARTIGGLCSRSLRFGTGMSLEEIVLRHALGMELPPIERERVASGVMMLPVREQGVLREVRGTTAARAVAPDVEVTITAHHGQALVPLPEGNAYLGFIFARGDSPAAVEQTLRESHDCLHVELEPTV